ncbi:MAG: Crp/Fnr family transcriptional regulator [Bryobacteraceae bacterium]
MVGPKRTLDFDIEGFLESAGDNRTVLRCRKKKVLFSQGDPADAIFYVQKGRVKLTVISKHGKEAIIGILGAGDFFGEGCLAGQAVRMSTAAALAECSILRLERADIVRLLHDERSFAEVFLRYLLTRNVRIEEDLIDQLFNSSEKRLARVLLLLANFGKEAKPEPVVSKVSQETLAAMIGTTRSRVNFFMNRFRKLGFIEYNGVLKVNSSLLTVVLHD